MSGPKGEIQNYIRAEQIITWQLIGLGSEQDSQGDVDVLEILGAGDGGDILGPGSDVEHDGSLDPWDHEMSSFSDHDLFHT